MNSLLQEFATMSTTAAETAPEWMVQQGVPRSVLYGPHACIVGATYIETDGRYFQPVSVGKPAIVVPVAWSIEAGDICPIDLVAWRPIDPDTWFFRTGYGDVLGAENVDEASLREIPLLLHSSPAAWLQSGMRGICVLDWNCCPTLYLANISRIVTNTPALARRLGKVASGRAWSPDVRVMEGIDAAA